MNRQGSSTKYHYPSAGNCMSRGKITLLLIKFHHAILTSTRPIPCSMYGGRVQGRIGVVIALDDRTNVLHGALLLPKFAN